MIKGSNINSTIVDGYLQLLDTLTPLNKLDIISRLSESMKIDITDKKKIFKKSFGAFKSKKSAEQIIEEIRSSRTFNREIEPF